MARRPLWSGSLTFGLVRIPVRLYTAVQQHELHFNQLHGKDGARIKQKRVCAADGEEVPFDEIVKGYEISKDRYVVLQADELKQFEAKASRDIEIEDFVELPEIDPVYYDASYHCVPEPAAAKAFHLLTEAMRRSNKVGIARIVMRSRESVCAVRPHEHGLMLSTLNLADEIVPESDLEDMPKEFAPTNPRELDMAEKLIDSLSAKFEPEKYKDDYRDRLLDFIRTKEAGGNVVGEPESAPHDDTVINLMDALKKSLEKGEASGARRHRAEAARTVRTPPKKKSAR